MTCQLAGAERALIRLCSERFPTSPKPQRQRRRGVHGDRRRPLDIRDSVSCVDNVLRSPSPASAFPTVPNEHHPNTVLRGLQQQRNYAKTPSRTVGVLRRGRKNNKNIDERSSTYSMGLSASSGRSAGGNVCIFVVYLRCIYYVNTVIKLQSTVQPAQDISATLRSLSISNATGIHH